MFYYPSNQGQLNSTQLSRDSQVYQPNQPNQQNNGYDMGMGGNGVDWSASNQRKLDKNSNVFIPGGQRNYPPPLQVGVQVQQPMPNHPNAGAGQMVRGQPRQAPQQENVARQDMRRMDQGYPDPRMMAHDPPIGTQSNPNQDFLFERINDLKDPTKKYEAMKELSNHRDEFPPLPPILWYTTGTIAILLNEIINIYPNLSPPTLTQAHSDRVCCVLGLLQSIALNTHTRPLFIKSNLHMYLYPFINKVVRQKPFEHLRVTSLGVIGALVKSDDPATIKSLIQTELIVLCLRIMKKGNDLSRTVATFIVHKILQDDYGLNYVCETEEKLVALALILKDIIEEIAKTPKDPDQNRESSRLLRHIIRCLLRLSENPSAAQYLGQYIPDCIKYNTNEITDDDQIRRWTSSLLRNIQNGAAH